ncbi:MAG: dipeptidase [Oligoflexus sp.]
MRMCKSSIFWVIAGSIWHFSAMAEEKNHEQEAQRIHAAAPVVDGHNDLPWQLRIREMKLNQTDLKQDLSSTGLHTDIPRLRQGGVGLQLWSAYVPANTSDEGKALHTTLEQIDLIHRLVDSYPESFEMVATSQEAKEAIKAGKIASMIGVEGGYSMEESLPALRNMYRLGVRYMTLTHSKSISWADSATDEEKNGGLTPFGKEVIQEMNRLGMLVDIAHVSFKTMKDVLQVTRAPIISSHSSAYAVTPHPRNVPDDVLRLVTKNGGLIMVNFYSGYINNDAMKHMEKYLAHRDKLRSKISDEDQLRKQLREWAEKNPMPKGTVKDVADHIDHIVKLAGIDHVGIGSDYDGVGTLPEGLEDVATYPNLTAELLRRGYQEDDILKIMGGNFFRVLESAEQIAAKMQTGQLAH